MALLSALGTWALFVGVLFVASAITRDGTEKTLVEAGDSLDAVSVAFLTVMAQPSLILAIGFIGALIITGAFLLKESGNWGRW